MTGPARRADRPDRPDLGGGPAGGAHPLRVVSYNLRGMRDDVAALTTVVRGLDPDVLLLQEIPRHPLSTYRVSDLARRCDLLWSGRTRRLSGTTLLTSLRVRSSPARDVALPVAGRPGTRRGNPRSWTWAWVRPLGAAPVAVVSAHLSLLPGERVDHVRRIVRGCGERGIAPARLVVGGDLNEDASGPAWASLADSLTEVTADRPTFPAARPHRRIDAIFAGAGLRPVTAVPGAPWPVATLPPRLLAAASDHLPVWVDLQV